MSIYSWKLWRRKKCLSEKSLAFASERHEKKSVSTAISILPKYLVDVILIDLTVCKPRCSPGNWPYNTLHSCHCSCYLLTASCLRINKHSLNIFIFIYKQAREFHKGKQRAVLRLSHRRCCEQQNPSPIICWGIPNIDLKSILPCTTLR